MPFDNDAYDLLTLKQGLCQTWPNLPKAPKTFSISYRYGRMKCSERNVLCQVNVGGSEQFIG